MDEFRGDDENNLIINLPWKKRLDCIDLYL